MTINTISMVRMTISGAVLTENARERMGDGDWKGALQFLVDSLEGMTYDQAISIIEGKNKLTGENNSILMEPEDPVIAAELQEQYKAEYGFGQYVRVDNKIYEPYMVLDNLGPQDVDAVLALPECASGTLPNFTRFEGWVYDNETVHAKSCYSVLSAEVVELRGRHYLSNPNTDKVKLLVNGAGRNVLVAYRQVAHGVTPFWREKDNSCFAKAFAAAESYLPVSGFSQHYGFAHPEKVGRAPVAPVVEDPQLAQERLERIAAEDAEATERAAQHAAEAVSLRARIAAFADADAEFGWQEYRWRDSQDGTYLTLRAPKRALQCYALSQTSAYKLMPAYEAFSPDSFKTCDDNRFHTDVWLGCGFDLDDKTYRHDSREYRAILDLMFEVQRTLLDFQVQVLARGPEVTGKVVFFDSEGITKDCVLVVPHAGVEFELQALAAGAVICEAGGRLAHLVTVCREQAKPILRMENACTTFHAGQTITVHPDTGRVSIWAVSGAPPVA